MWINDKVTYTPEITTITKGEPVQAVIESVSVSGNMLTLRLPDGATKHVPVDHCVKA